MIKTIILLLISSASLGQLKSFSEVKAIHAVWSLSSQPCNGGYGNSMERYKDEGIIKQTKLIELPHLGLNLKVPQVQEYESTTVKLFLNDKSRGVIDHYILMSANDLSVPFAAIVITELPEQLQFRDKAFAAVKTLQNRSAFNSGLKINFTKINGIHGESLDLILKNRLGSHCFPTSEYQFSKSSNTIGISRFSFVENKLIEFALILNTQNLKGVTNEHEYARKSMDLFWSLIE